MLLGRCQIVQQRLTQVENKLLLHDWDRPHLTAPIPPMSICYFLQLLNLEGLKLCLRQMLSEGSPTDGSATDLGPRAQRAIPSRFRQRR